ncbi:MULTISPECIES: hypothetical protein [Ralstonia]|uniref:Uncharacterized protein n=1 Tax=Ralstonia pickettii TaxID=329 RepID=A0AAW4QAX0_RALPI|nr:hypothetical protein [Ralstonia pickettii]MBX3755890.1 hypothetical protein [Ralstonia pickettii]MBX3785941.1 hypothetical protein [Ralstonia pickettii]MBX3791391.1 hypothetical protein [Ralstonia pickettii]MBX3794276.1 hypothetical protein [Ralstonia pickettii]MBX3808986.1 hypothetical protein [Ralstonia pickettii]
MEKKIAPVLQLSCHVDVDGLEGVFGYGVALRHGTKAEEIGDGSRPTPPAAREQLPQAGSCHGGLRRHSAIKTM